MAIIKQIAEDVDGIRIEPLIWSLAFGSCLGGMGTLIGASDNVVMAGIAEKAGYHVSFMAFMRIGFPFMIQSVTITTVWMLFLNAIGMWDDFTEGEYSQIVEESTPHGYSEGTPPGCSVERRGRVCAWS